MLEVPSKPPQESLGPFQFSIASLMRLTGVCALLVGMAVWQGLAAMLVTFGLYLLVVGILRRSNVCIILGVGLAFGPALSVLLSQLLSTL